MKYIFYGRLLAGVLIVALSLVMTMIRGIGDMIDNARYVMEGVETEGEIVNKRTTRGFVSGANQPVEMHYVEIRYHGGDAHHTFEALVNPLSYHTVQSGEKVMVQRSWMSPSKARLYQEGGVWDVLIMIGTLIAVGVFFYLLKLKGDHDEAERERRRPVYGRS